MSPNRARPLADPTIGGMVDRVMIRPPAARVGPLTRDERAVLLRTSALRGKYDQPLDRDSAYEMLARKAQAEVAPVEELPASGGLGGLLGGLLGGVIGGGTASRTSVPSTGRGTGSRPRMTMTERVVTNMASSAARTVGNQIGRAILRGVLGSITRR